MSLLSIENPHEQKSMTTAQKHQCNQCGMRFPSDEAVYQHKKRFCIGVKDSGIGRKPIDSDMDETDASANCRECKHKKRSTKKASPRKSPVTKRGEEVDEGKQQRRILRRIEDIESRILNDQYQTNKITESVRKQDHIYHGIIHEYDRIRREEQEVLRRMYTLQSQSRPLKEPQRRVKRSSESIPLDPFEELQRKNARLDKERRTVQKRVEQLISIHYKPVAMTSYDPQRLLREMKEQQHINEKALEYLRGRQSYPRETFLNDSEIPPLPYINRRSSRSGHRNSDEVRSFRQDYMQSGGHDARTIARYSGLENRLRSYEDAPWSKGYPEPLQPARYQSDQYINREADQLKSAVEENSRLKNELQDIQRKFETLDSRTKQLEQSLSMQGKANGNDQQRFYPPQTYSQPVSSSYANHSDQVYQQQLQPRANFNSQSQITAQDTQRAQFNQHQTILPHVDKRNTPRASPPMSLIESNMFQIRDALVSQPYEPTNGFVIFFDFLCDVPPTVEQCRLVTCLHHPQSGLGPPSILEPVQCEQFVDSRTGDSLRVTIISTKQPVARCPPQQALTVVIEVQVSTDRQAPAAQLKTSALVKLPLFDNQNRLASGRWKVPLKALPVDHNESLAVFTTQPSYERTELYYRLVNSQEGDQQAIVPLLPNHRDQYQYPLQYRI